MSIKLHTLNSKKKILFLTKYSSIGASSRLRSYQYIPFIENAGFTVVVKPFFDEEYLRELYDGRRAITSVINSFIRRVFTLFSVYKYDKLVVEKEIFPFLPAWPEKILNILGVKYIVDYDDAIFHYYDQNPNFILRKFLKNKIATVIKNSALTIVGNEFLADYALKSGAKKVQIIPTVIDLNRYPVKENKHSDNFVIGWIGTKSTFEKHLLLYRNLIQRIQDMDSKIEFHIIGIPNDMNMGKQVKWIPWNEETESEELRKLDIGIMPLKNSLWEKGKCAYKLIQYAACGVPGIASDVGMNREVIICGETGFLAYTEDEWIQLILKLKENKVERNHMGQSARKLVIEKYCIQVTAPKWIKALESVG